MTTILYFFFFGQDEALASPKFPSGSPYRKRRKVRDLAAEARERENQNRVIRGLYETGML